MNAGRIAERIVANEGKPIHWVTAAARRIVDGEDFDAVMQDLARQHTLHSVSAFDSVKRELAARVEQERSGREAAREGPAMNDRDFFKPPAPATDMTLERFRSIALEVLRDKKAPFPASARLDYIKSKGAEYGLNVDDNWLTDLLNEASEGEIAQRISGPNIAL